MKVTPATRNTMSNMISNVRLNSNVTGLSAVKEVERIDTSNNSMSTNSQIITKDYFYDKLEKKEKEMEEKNFHKNDEKKKEIKISKEEKETIDFLKNMFKKFNNSMDNIKRIDMARNQNNFFKIKKVIDENSRFMASIGIMNDKLSHFYIKEEVFVKEIMKSPQKIHQLLEPQTGVIRKLCDSFGKMLI